ncbi:unnamed protein product [Toxocara canis]|uniref:Nuclear receptor domain-containing protein n=1 Tax=Toxocara canis TaxID=6265 RepID=A0A183UR27_TOXCA|nr:unnamed protein product [Toxocara canis]
MMRSTFVICYGDHLRRTQRTGGVMDARRARFEKATTQNAITRRSNRIIEIPPRDIKCCLACKRVQGLSEFVYYEDVLSKKASGRCVV